jgi:general stress protein 26
MCGCPHDQAQAPRAVYHWPRRGRLIEVATMTNQHGQRDARVTPTLVIRQIRKQHFTVLSTVGRDGAPHSAGVSYGSTRSGDAFTIYVMTRRHLLKARNIHSDPRVSMVIPIPRPVLSFLPPATIQLHGRAELLDWDDAAGTSVFEKFWMGRRILQGYRRAREEGETRVCFVKIIPYPQVRTYMVGYRIWELRRNMEVGSAGVALPPGL